MSEKYIQFNVKTPWCKGLFMQQPYIPYARKIQTATDIPQI